MGEFYAERRALGQHLTARRPAILEAWRTAVKRDPKLTSGDSLPRRQLFDHIPTLLLIFERQLSARSGDDTAAAASAQQPAAAHGLQRWQQGYDLREVTRELGKLNECVVAELEGFTAANPQASPVVTAAARRLWAALCSTGIEESVGQYFQLQQQEAVGHVKDLESALVEVRELEAQRADLWRQAAHDLRGNLGVVANATVGLAHDGLRDAAREDFLNILSRNVASLHHLLDDVTSLARLQAGREHRQIEAIDIGLLLQQLCEGIRPQAQQRRLFLRCEGPTAFIADGDAVKIRRIAQNLILNAVKFTRQGGVTVSWGNSGPDDNMRWELCVSDSGPGFHSDSGMPMAKALNTAAVDRREAADETAPTPVVHGAALQSSEAGEGIGLSIVKRLCELLDATIEMMSVENVGTSFRILFPRRYPQA